MKIYATRGERQLRNGDRRCKNALTHLNEHSLCPVSSLKSLIENSRSSRTIFSSVSKPPVMAFWETKNVPNYI
jgi:hypothetical protein